MTISFPPLSEYERQIVEKMAVGVHGWNCDCGTPDNADIAIAMSAYLPIRVLLAKAIAAGDELEGMCTAAWEPIQNWRDATEPFRGPKVD